MIGWTKLCKLVHAFLWENSHNRLKLAQLLGRHGAFLTWLAPCPLNGDIGCAASPSSVTGSRLPPRARPHCRVVRTANPLYPRFTNIFGNSISETLMRPNPTAAPGRAGLSASLHRRLEDAGLQQRAVEDGPAREQA